MSRYCGNKDSTEVVKAADIWKEKCLLNDGSVFSNDTVWTLESFSELYELFTENPDEGSGKFLDKLEGQLKEAKNETKKLAAEMLWLMQLFIANAAMKADTKRSQLSRVWSWTGEDLDVTNTLLQAPLEYGIGNPGTAYNTRRWAEFRYFIDVVSSFKKLSSDEQSTKANDPWDFSTWLDTFEKHGHPQLRHIIKFLLFPDYFERIATGKHKRAIVNAFHNKNIKPGKFNFTELDKEVYEIRQELEAKYDSKDIDFYSTAEINQVWQGNKDVNADKSISTSDVVLAINEIDERGVKGDEKSSTYDLIYHANRYPPKLVYALAHKHAGGEELDRSSFNGGEGTECFSKLRELGFCIERKDYVSNLLSKFIEQADAEDNLKTKEYSKKYCNLDVKVSFGQGVFARVPWISLTGFGQVVSNGIYPGFLYYKSIGVLLLTYGISDSNPPTAMWKDLDSKEKIHNFLQSEYDHNSERYGDSYVYKAYKLPKDFKEQEFTKDLDNIVYEYEKLMVDTKKYTSSEYKPLGIQESNMANYPNNLIYYGPPGTGKTYTTMERAVEICDGTAPSDRTELVSRFKELQNDKRVSFVTFHQSYSYEDFVEGIRPVLTESGADSSISGGDVQYECRPGVFRSISTLAKSNQVSSKSVYDFNEDEINIWKMSLGDTQLSDETRIYDDCIENNMIWLGYGKGLDYSGCNDRSAVVEKLREVKPDIENNDYNITSINYFKNKIKVDDLVIVTDGNLKFRAVGRITGDYSFTGSDDYNQARSVEWLVVYDESQPYEKILNKKFSQMTLYHLKKKVLKVDALKKLLTSDDISEPENHVLIIDEINRGNIAKIFGELITLLEMDKRLGAKNELTVTLPYSGDDFGVPENLYIIGTMNTADRSIALLDTALRRRFEFEELMPDVSVIKGSDGKGTIPCPDGSEIDVRKFLTSVNQRISFMLNRDQTIGHAYLINVETFKQFSTVLTQQIIPLLQEYFYEDWHRIQLVFRDVKDGNEKNNPQLIKHTKMDEVDILGYDHEEYDDQIEYSVVPTNEILPEMIRKVYESKND